MPTYRHPVSFRRLSASELDAWREYPAALIADCLNRSQFMDSGIKPLAQGRGLIGQARTVTTMAGDNGPIHLALAELAAGEVLVIDAGGISEVAVWGGILCRAAMARGAGGVVIDGAVRDLAEIRELPLPVFARAVVPGGPHKGFGGTLDGAISCGGCPVAPGDLVIGDDDGVVMVPQARLKEVLAACAAKVEQERQWMARIAAGETTAEILDLAPAESLES